MEARNEIKILISALKLAANKDINTNNAKIQQRINFLNKIEEEICSAPDYLWDTISNTSFESPSNQYSMF